MAAKANSKEVALEVKGVSKSFHLPTEQSNGIKQAFINWTKGVKGYKEQQVLKDISFTVEKGDFFGIVGRNGSGKSTLLKLISQIYTPDKGKIAVNGKLVPFIELGVGFNPELTGRENIYLNGALLGFSHDEMSAMYEDIVKFAELEEFMDQKLKNYSSGMQVRLAFSIAIKADADILVLDEVLAVGDEAFQRKCDKFFSSIKEEREKTIILVTHSMDSVRKYCNKAIMIHSGEIVTESSPEDVANMYSLENNQAAISSNAEQDSKKVKNIKIQMESPEIIDEDTQFRVSVSYDTSEDETGIYICLFDIDNNVPLYDCPLRGIKGQSVSKRLAVDIREINNRNIKVTASVRDRDNNIIGFLPEDEMPSFLFRRRDHLANQPTSSYGIINNNGVWCDG